MTTQEVGSEFAFAPASPVLDSFEREIVPSSQINVQRLYESVSKECSHRTLNEFLKEAKKVQLDMAEFEMYLNCLEKGLIVSKKETYRQLFLHACSLDLEDKALHYLTEGKEKASLDHYSLFVELLSQKTIPSLALKHLCKDKIVLQKAEATIPTVLRLLGAGVAADCIIVDSMPCLEWAFERRDAKLIGEICATGARITPSCLSNPFVIAFFHEEIVARRSEFSANYYILHELQNMRASLDDQRIELFKLAATDDDEKMAHLLYKGLDGSKIYDGYTLLHIACKTSRGSKVAKYLLDEGAVCNAPASAENKSVRPLHIAVESANGSLVQLLLSRGANLFQENADKVSGFQAIMQSDVAEIRATLLDPTIQPSSWPLDNWVPALQKMHLGKPPSPQLIQFLQSIIITVPPEEMASQRGSELFAELARFEIWDAIQFLMQNTFELLRNHDNKEGPSPLTRVLEGKRVSAVEYLVKNDFLHPDTKTSNGNPLLFWAVEVGSSKLMNLLIEKKADFHAKSKDQETLLHFAARKKDTQCVLWCLGNTDLDVNALDIHKRPALYYALVPTQVEMILSLLKAGARPFFLADRLYSYSIVVNQMGFEAVLSEFALWKNFAGKAAASRFPEFLNQCGKAYPQEALEIFFLIPLRTSPHMFFQTKKEYVIALLGLHKKYPEAPLEYFYNFLMQVNEIHLTRKILDFKIPQVLQEVDIKQILNEFDELNWTNPAAPAYCNPDDVLVMGQSNNKETLRTALQTLVEAYIPRKITFTGTPPAGTVDLQIFYDSLETTLKHIVLMKKDSQDVAKRTKAILKLAWASVLCGTRWEETSLRVFQKLKFPKKKEELLEDLFDESLAQVREAIARSIANQSTHGYRQLVRAIGKEYNIPMAEGIPNVAEPHEQRYLTPGYCKYSFALSYIANLLVPHTYSFFESRIAKNDGVLIKWFKQHIPENFTFADYQEVAWSTACIQLFANNPVEQNLALKQIFANKGIYVSAGAEAVDVLRTYRESEYIEMKVYDLEAGKVKMDGVINFLLQRGVLTECFPGIFLDFLNIWKRMQQEAAPASS